jgi:tRNA 2-thiouridine synthesizing protein A
MWRGPGVAVKEEVRTSLTHLFGLVKQHLDPSRGQMNDTADVTTIDLRGLKCPLPALRTRKVLSRLQGGAILVVECTDPLAEIDIPNLVRETGDLLEDKARRDNVLVFRIRKRGV